MENAPSDSDLLFEIDTPLGFSIRVTAAYWQRIVTIKHPVMRGRAAAVRETLMHPDEVRRSTRDEAVHLFYKQERERRWTCAVVKRLNGDGFLITTYPTNAIKEGRKIWPP